jgi:small subunit ribosomal protein S1
VADKGKGFADLFAEMEKPAKKRRVKVGDRVTAKVVVIGKDSVFVDLGAKAEGVIDRGELVDDSGLLTVKEGDEVTARVASTSGGHIVLKTKLGRGADAAKELEHAKDARIPVTGTITGVNKGGAEVEIGSVRAFCPVSQLDIRYVEDPSSYVGQKLDFLVTRYEEGRGGKPNVVVSRRALLEEENAKRAEETRAKLEVGAVLTGVVTTIKDYGAFVDLGGIEGMLHITELGFERVGHPSEVISEGDTLEVQVTKIEQGEKRERISLSLKALKDDPFDAAADQLEAGQTLKGKVVRTEPFGAFVELPGGAQGLVHVSELGAGRRVNHARDVVEVGQEVEVAVLGIDREKKRISLSMKAVGASREAAQARNYKPSGGSLGTFGDLLKDKLKK